MLIIKYTFEASQKKNRKVFAFTVKVKFQVSTEL